MGGKLTAAEVKALTKPGRHTDGDGLHLYVKSSGRRTWVLRFMKNRRSRDMGLGSYPAVSLKQAREVAAVAREKLDLGVDPVLDRSRRSRAGMERTFRVAAEQLIADKASGWRNEKHAWQWRRTLEQFTYPVLGDRCVQDIDSDAVMQVLRPIWDVKPETASRLRGRIEAVLDAATARGWRSGENPARWKGHLAARLPSAGKVRAPEHYPSLPWQQVTAFIAELRKREGMSHRAIEFVILTAARSGEARGATWSEIDFQTAIWTIPAKRMKAWKLHRVPLSGAAITLLRSVWLDGMRPTDLIFSGMRSGQPLSDMSLTAVLRKMNATSDESHAPWRDGITGGPIVVHGFRSSFRVWAGEETSYPREVVEAALAHANRNRVEATYARTDLVEKRRPLMTEWALHCLGGDPASG